MPASSEEDVHELNAVMAVEKRIANV